MNQSPLVSIALCTYNGAQYLAEQLDTLVNQTYSNIEIIVVDDCSTDNTYQILCSYAQKFPQFKIYQNEENVGYIENFEKALKLCAGELIALCDQDDIWNLQKIELQVNSIGDNQLIYHDSSFINEEGMEMNLKISDKMHLYKGGNPLVFLFFNCVSGHSILMKRAVIAAALPLKKDYFHDWWLAYVATNIGEITFIPQCLVKYRQHSHSETNILRTKREKEKHENSSIVKIERIYVWLGFCKDFKKNKNQALIDLFCDAYSKRTKSYISFTLSQLLFKSRNEIFVIRKKSKLNMFNYIFSQIWGLKTKALYSKKVYGLNEA